MQTLHADLKANRNNPKGSLIASLFRVGAVFRAPSECPPRWWAVPYLVLYRVFVEWLLGVELPVKTEVGDGLTIFHGQGTVINDGCHLGANVVLRHNVTIGHLVQGGQCPTIGDGVQIGAGAIILGGITIGSGATVGAGAVVLTDVPEGATVVGNPGRVVTSRLGIPTSHNKRIGEAT